MTENGLRAGVVGVGAFGRHHVRHFARNERTHLIAVCDGDVDAATRVAEAHGCACFVDPSELIGRVDAVSIAVPAVHHHAVAAPLIDAGIHVLIEKPLAPDPDQARDLADRAVAAGVVLQVGHIERFSPAMARLMAEADHPRRISAIRRSPWTGRSTDVDVVLDMMIHDIDHVLRLVESPPVSITASSSAVRGEQGDEAEAWLTFANGATATLSASRVADAAERTLSITELTRSIRADFAVPSLTIINRRTGSVANAALPANDNLGDQIAAFVASILDGAPVSADAAAGVAAVEVAERIRAAAAEESTHVSELI